MIKIFDRIHNLQTLGAKSPEKARKIIEETMTYFITLGSVQNWNEAMAHLMIKFY